jgi:hypothetical protein
MAKVVALQEWEDQIVLLCEASVGSVRAGGRVDLETVHDKKKLGTRYLWEVQRMSKIRVIYCVSNYDVFKRDVLLTITIFWYVISTWTDRNLLTLWAICCIQNGHIYVETKIRSVCLLTSRIIFLRCTLILFSSQSRERSLRLETIFFVQRIYFSTLRLYLHRLPCS